MRNARGLRSRWGRQLCCAQEPQDMQLRLTQSRFTATWFLGWVWSHLPARVHCEDGDMATRYCVACGFRALGDVYRTGRR